MKVKTSSEYLYYYLLVLLLVNNWWGDLKVFVGLYEIFKPIVLGSAIILAIFLVFKSKYSILEVLIILSFTITGAYSAYITGSMWTLYAMILIGFARNIDIEKTINIIYKCMSIFIFIALSIFIFQFLFMPSSLLAFYDGSRLKYNMTFVGANEAARYWVYWFMLFTYLNMNKKVSNWKKILIAGITILFYVCTYSDTLLLVLLLACLKLLRTRNWMRIMVEKCAGYSFIVACLFSLLILKFEGTWFFNIVNRFVTGRFALGLLGFETYGISLFGQEPLEFYVWVGNVTGRRLVLDNAYYMIMLQYGIFYVVLISFLFFKAKKRLDYRSACCLLAYSGFALAANTILSPTAIFPVIIAANLCWKSEKEEVVCYECVKSAT